MHPDIPTLTTPRRLPFLLLAFAAAAMHVLLWQGMSAYAGVAPGPERNTPAVQVRTVAPPVAQAEPAALPVPPAAPAPRRKTAPAAPVVVEAQALLVASASAPSSPNSHPEQDEVPVYRTQMPPPITLSYDLSYGRWSGSGEMQWRPQGNNYEARLEGRVAGMRLLTWKSQGGFDSAGIAPVRYTDERARKSPQAANFQRQAGKITFSGPSTEYPLLRGTQDRLSWMLQIAAVAAADPKHMAPGGKVSFYVVGAKGDADLWTFRVEGREDADVREQGKQAVKLLREPRKAHDTKVEVWLAPGLHWLPVQARLTSEGSTMELRLQSSQATP